MIRKKKINSDFLKTIDLGGITYNIEFFTPSDLDFNLGMYSQKDCKILIADSLNDDQKIKTLIHEALHAIIAEYGVDVQEDFEEKIVVQLQTGVCELLAQLVDYVMEDL